MSERLTDEQLRATSEGDDCAYKRAMATELLALRADLARIELDSVLADLLNERARADALNAECVEAWRQFYLEKAKDGDVWKERATALRAERAKPTQSDDERAREIALNFAFSYLEGECGLAISATFASIRAEGSAERAKLEAALRKLNSVHRDELSPAARFVIDAALSQPAESGATPAGAKP